MPPSPSWRDRFIDLAAELCRALGETIPLHRTDPELALRLRLQVDGVAFEALHAGGSDSGTDRFVLHCRFGPLPEQDQTRALQHALESNRDLNRWQAGIFGLDVETDELVLSTQQALHGADAGALLRALQDLAAMAKAWRQAHHGLKA